MSNRSAAAVMAVTLAACGGPANDPAPPVVETNVASATDKMVAGMEAATKALSDGSAASPTVQARDCGAVKPSMENRNILGLAIGMTPTQIENILLCRGFVSTFPENEGQMRAREQEREQGLFRADYGLIGQGDFVRVFYDGPRNDQRVFFVGRTKVFQENPPTMDAVSRQFHDAFKLKQGARRTNLGNLEAGEIDPHPATPDAMASETKRCAGLALLHDPDDRFSAVMNPPPRGYAACGPSITLEIIQNGRNANLAYLARYRLANLQLGKRLQDARIAGEQNAEAARQDQQTKEAAATGKLPNL